MTYDPSTLPTFGDPQQVCPDVAKSYEAELAAQEAAERAAEEQRRLEEDEAWLIHAADETILGEDLDS